MSTTRPEAPVVSTTKWLLTNGWGVSFIEKHKLNALSIPRVFGCLAGF